MENGKQSAFGYGFANEQSHQESQGLTKREYFAAMAMQGLLANSTIVGLHNQDALNWISEHSISRADSLLTAFDELKKSE